MTTLERSTGRTLQYALERYVTLLIALDASNSLKNITLQDALLLECLIVLRNTSDRSRILGGLHQEKFANTGSNVRFP